MMRRQHSKKKQHGDREQQALLSQEEAPILSDEISDSTSPETKRTHTNNAASYNTGKVENEGKKRGWRSRLFGGGNNNNTQSARSASAPRPRRDTSRLRGRNNNSSSQPAAHGVTTGGSHQQQQQQQRPQKQQRSRSARGTTKPERRDDSNHQSNMEQAPLPTSQRSKNGPAPSPPVLVSKLKNRQSAIRTPGNADTSINSRNKCSSPVMAALQAEDVLHNRRPTTRAPNIKARSSLAASSTQVSQILKRPFGREAVKPQDQQWLVQAAPAEWDGDDSVWKYRVTLHKRVASGQEEILEDLTSDLTLRSLADFGWLEQALRAEFQGALLIPSLSIALGVPDPSLCQHEVDAPLLTNWLSDVMNGIRGQGEWALNKPSSTATNDAGGQTAAAIFVTSSFPINWLTCESMEAFLYRTDLLREIRELPRTPALHMPGSPNRNGQFRKQGGEEGGIFKWVMNGDVCGGFVGACAPTTGGGHDDATTSGASFQEMGGGPQQISPRRRKINIPLNKHKVSSKALGDARSLNVQDSFADLSPTFDVMNSEDVPVQHADLLQAEKELVWSWRSRALQTMEKLRVVQEEEKHVGGAWKRFAISLSNLFAYEKDVESARLGDSKTRKDLQMPYRKLQKSSVDDVLRIVAKHKLERCTPSLDLMKAMLSAYVADLSAVQPALESYLEAIQQLSLQAEFVEVLKAAKPEQAVSSTFADHFQAGLDQVKKQLVSLSDDIASEEKTRMSLRVQQEELQLESMKQRLKENEGMLKAYLTRMCRTVPVRTARMAFGYMQVETKQAGALHGSAINMKAKVDVASKETLSKMIHRHHTETKEDRATELQLVQRIVNIGNTKKFSTTDDGAITEEIESGVEINKDVENEKAAFRDKALNLCHERMGRWDSNVAMSIMEAVGVGDANVRVEETTRDLRLVRKYAIGLREHVQRSIEALGILRTSILQGGFGDIRDLRHDLVWEMQTLFSGTYQPIEQPNTPLNIQSLIEAGVSLSDPLGWRRKDDGCGGVIRAYMDSRESGTEWLLTTLGELLKEYNNRVESVESFVYMECVGIQLEKHFSQQRATALSAFEKKTDITSAINIATRKRMPVLVKELQAKLESVGAEVSHTTVKEAKEAHLESKILKQELHDLSMRRLTRARETSTEQVIALMTVWSKEEESAASTELKLLKDLSNALEISIGPDELSPYLEASPAVSY